MQSCQQFIESVCSYSLPIRSTVSDRNIMLRCELIMFLALNVLKCLSHSTEDAGRTNNLNSGTMYNDGNGDAPLAQIFRYQYEENIMLN